MGGVAKLDTGKYPFVRWVTGLDHILAPECHFAFMNAMQVSCEFKWCQILTRGGFLVLVGQKYEAAI